MQLGAKRWPAWILQLDCVKKPVQKLNGSFATECQNVEVVAVSVPGGKIEVPPTEI